MVQGQAIGIPFRRRKGGQAPPPPTEVAWNPTIESNMPYKDVKYYKLQEGGRWQSINIGDMLPINQQVLITITTEDPIYEVSEVHCSQLTAIGVSGKDGVYNIVGFTTVHSPQIISVTIGVDKNYVQWNPTYNSNVKYSEVVCLNYTEGLKTVNVGDYVKVGNTLAIRVILDNTLDEVVNTKVNGQECEITVISPRVFDCKFAITSNSPQTVDITIDEYIRYEDIVQPYPFMIRIYDSETNHIYTWGDKLKVGSKIVFKEWANNLLPELYKGYFHLNQADGSNIAIELNKEYEVFKGFGFTVISLNYIGGTNVPKCFLSPSRLRIPNSSYKILGYIPDISGHGNHGKINNSAYAGMSGANGYPNNFNGYTVVSGVTKTDSGIKVEKELIGSGWLLLIPAKTAVASMKLNIVGIPSNKIIKWSTNVEGIGDITLVNGINEIPTYTSASTSGIYTIFSDLKDLKIEQIGEYEGAYCLDGVDDFISIPTTVGGKQVLMKVNWQSSIAQGMLYDQRGYANEFAIWNSNSLNDNVDGVISAYQSRNNGQTYIDGILNNNIKASELRAITHNITITNELSSGVNNTYPVIGANKTVNGYFANMSLYDFMLFDEISTDEEILTLNKHIGIEPKVTVPPYYWDAYGRSNMEASYDRALMLNLGKIPSNDTSNALTAKNFAWDLMSGYGGWEFPKFTDDVAWHISPNTSIEVVNRTNYSVTLRKLANTDYFYFQKAVSLIYRQVPFKVRTDKAIKVCWDLHYTPTGGTEQSLRLVEQLVQPNVDTMVTLTYKTEEELNDLNADLSTAFYIVYFDLYTMTENEEVTVTELPLYPNGLCLDGVDDYLFNANIPAFTDYTYVLKRELLDLDKAGGNASMYKGSFVPAGGRAFIADYYINSGVGTDGAYGFSFGSSIKSPTLLTDKTVYGTKTSVNGVSITPGSATDDASLTLGKWDANYKQMVFYKLMLYPKTIDMLSIGMLCNMLEKDELIDLSNPVFKQ